MRNFKIGGLSQLQSALKQSPEAAHRGAVKGLHQSMTMWQRGSRERAPVDTAVLRRNILTEVDTVDLKGTISSNAYRRGFNYAYYQHEVNGKQYLTDEIEASKERYKATIERNVADELKKAGWQ
ncbi:hypothetical protein [Geomicrobium sediminis]|uniref:HK97 gp10 family phage protein n=1 Tax=Geomicrobium sediminis TaxID=1347788 RepID=A0ABS2PI59_9BACL|nr:hypothetical protein [Geomicrobium sediminis]MBM7634947.1 hypothetical protein [Geomicrobium sediminis]